MDHVIQVYHYVGSVTRGILFKVLDLANSHFPIIGSHSKMVQLTFISDTSALLISRLLGHGGRSAPDLPHHRFTTLSIDVHSTSTDNLSLL